MSGAPAIALPVRILGTASVLPGPPRTTAEIVKNLERPSDPAKWEQRTGIRARHWAPPGALVAPMAVEALKGALAAARMEATDLRRILFTCSSGGDVTFPATANLVAAGLGLRGTCDAFDVNNACMGFLTAFDIAARSVATGLGPVGIVSAEPNSRYIRPSDHRPYLVFGDAVAAAIVGEARPGEGVVTSFLGNDASAPDDVFSESPQVTGERPWAQFRGSNMEMLQIAMRTLQAGLAGTLERSTVALHDIEWIVFHQGNGVMLDFMVAGLGLDPARVIRVVDEVGGVTSACIPLCLDRLLRTRPVRPGDRILMAGIGGGVSYGATLYRVGGAVTGDVALPVRVLGTAAVLPGPPLTTAEIAREVSVRHAPRELEARTGIHTRHWAEAGALAAPLAAEAIRRALAAAGLTERALARVVYVCSMGGDMICPATGNKVIHALGLDRRCDTFDINGACLGFLSALDVAARSIATGMGPVGIVNAELGSRAIRKEDHRPWLICGDAVVATIVGPARPHEGIVASHAVNDPTFSSDAHAGQPVLTNQREYLHFRPPSHERALAADALLDRALEPVLARARVRLHEVEWVLLHQPTGAWLDAATKRLELDPSRVVRVVDAIGSVASASIPAALDRLLRTRPVRAGDRVLMAGVGGGPAAGAVLYRVGGDA